MTRLAMSSIGMVAVAIGIAAPARAAVLRAPVAHAATQRTSESGPPATDPAANHFRWHLANPHPCVRDPVVLVVAGFEPTPCDSFVGAFARDPSHVVYHTAVRDSVPCPAVMPRIHPIRLDLGLFPAGPQKIEIEWVIDHHTPNGGAYTEVRRAVIDFVVSAECVVFGDLPYVFHVQIGPPDGRIPPCIVPGDSIPVLIEGSFPNACFRLVGIEVLPGLTASPLRHPPRVRITVKEELCPGAGACPDVVVRWRASAVLPPLPSSAYKLPVELALVHCRGAQPPEDLFVAGFPFVVAADCAPRAGCILPSFDPGGAPHECDARVGPDQPAHLKLYVRSSIALSGLQGELALGDTTLLIGSLTPAGPAEGMLLRWESTPRGAKFALVSDRGVTIPPVAPTDPAPPVLDIEVVQGGRPAPVTLLQLVRLLAVDEAGHDAPWCPTLFAGALRYAAYARICSGPAGPCDFNGDGREDIRDLVLMMRCLREGTLCGESPARFDCNQDQTFSIDDVICCAERILGQDCPGCPPGETRDARDVKIGFGPPVGRIQSLDLPVRIEGAGGIGGARLALRFPDERYEVSGVDFGGAAASWLHVSQVSGGRVLVGLIDPDAGRGSDPRAVITLHLALKPGREAGGDVTLESADFTARDGVKLAVQVPTLRQPLGITGRLALSENRPNPFAGATHFEVTLDRAGPVDVAIFDVGGRKLFTVYRGELPAGTREFTWDGRLADGSRARDGVYFYRAITGTETLARKLVLLRSP